MLTVENIRRMENFSESFDLLSQLMPDFVDGLSKARKSALVHFNDYDPFAFCVLSDYNRQEQLILVSDFLTGDVVGRFNSLEEFKNTVMKEIEEDIFEGEDEE